MTVKTELEKLLREITGDSTKTADSVADAVGKITTAYTPMKPAAAVSDSSATDVAGLKADYNALLAKLRTAGIISAS